MNVKGNSYTCNNCGHPVTDAGPYELPSGDYCCVGCYTNYEQGIINQTQAYKED